MIPTVANHDSLPFKSVRRPSFKCVSSIMENREKEKEEEKPLSRLGVFHFLTFPFLSFVIL